MLGKKDNIDANVTEKEYTLLQLLLNNTSTTTEQIAKKMKVARQTVYRLIKNLKEKGYIERVGSDKSGYWKILK